MKKIAIVEDRPWVMERAITEMKSAGIEIKAMLLLKNESPENIKEANRKFLRENQIPVEEFDLLSMEEILDPYYEQDDTILLLDLMLEPDFNIRNITERMTVRYADKKRRENGEAAANKIYFYTTSPENIVNWLCGYFPNQVITVFDFQDNQVVLDIERIREVAEVGKQ